MAYFTTLKPLTYEQLTAQCVQLHAELEGLTKLNLKNDSVVQDRRAKLLELIDHNLDVQSMWWPTLRKPAAKKVYSEIMEDYISHPDLTLEDLSKRHNTRVYKVQREISKEFKMAY